VSFLTTFEEWVDRSFARIFPAGRRYTLEDVAGKLEKSVLSNKDASAPAIVRVLMNEEDLGRLRVSPGGASVFLQSALGKRARLRGRPDSGEYRVEVAASDAVRPGEWKLDVVPQKSAAEFRTVFVDCHFETIKVPALVFKQNRYILFNIRNTAKIINSKYSDVVLYKDKVTIGRVSKDKNAFDIPINDMSVTGRKAHAFVTVKGNVVTVLDNQSTNGVTVNSLKIRKQVLSHGDEIGLGRAVLRFEWIDVDMEVME
jgi:hypothetical protein